MMDQSDGSEADERTMKAYYLDHFRRNRAAILEVAALGLDRPVNGCPGWDVAALTAHMGRVYTFWLKWVRERPRAFSREAFKEIAADRDARLPGYTAWDTAGFPKESRPDGILPFARQTGDELDAALVALEPQETVWTFIPRFQTGAFVFRRLALETGIHRWDAEDAHGIFRPIDDVLARDGIDEMLMMFRDDPAYERTGDRRSGQQILLREDSGSGHWLVSFSNTGITSSRDGVLDEGTGQRAIVTGDASDLLLFIMGRRSTDKMQIDGDKELAASWGDLAGRF